MNKFIIFCITIMVSFTIKSSYDPACNTKETALLSEILEKISPILINRVVVPFTANNLPQRSSLKSSGNFLPAFSTPTEKNLLIYDFIENTYKNVPRKITSQEALAYILIYAGLNSKDNTSNNGSLYNNGKYVDFMWIYKILTNDSNILSHTNSKKRTLTQMIKSINTYYLFSTTYATAIYNLLQPNYNSTNIDLYSLLKDTDWSNLDIAFQAPKKNYKSLLYYTEGLKLIINGNIYFNCALVGTKLVTTEFSPNLFYSSNKPKTQTIDISTLSKSPSSLSYVTGSFYRFFMPGIVNGSSINYQSKWSKACANSTSQILNKIEKDYNATLPSQCSKT
jgi:hypothetical protein